MIDEAKYEAGVCNIDAEGIRVRRRHGFISIYIGVVAVALVFLLHVEPIIRFIIIGGCAGAAAVNFLQAREHFCVVNAMIGFYEVGLKRTKIGRSESQIKIDRKKMLQIYGKVIAIAIAAGSFGLLPL
jgi:hypothetical protein